MPGALNGLRVLDLSRVLAGPFCCMMLGDHGADVVKVEPPGGDETRAYGPPFLSGESVYYMSINRNKRGIALDLKQPEGQAVLRRLVQWSDVLVENFRTGTLERWGLGWEALRPLNPRLIYCAISGFGRSGPYAQVPGYDGAIQAFAGLMSVTGSPEAGPTKAGIAVGDLATGLMAAQGILLALYSRAATGVGQRVEVSLLESLVSLLQPHHVNYLNTGFVAGPHGNSHPMIAPYDLLPTADRPIYLPGGNDGQFRKLAAAIGQPQLADDPRFCSNAERVRHRPQLLAELSAALRQRPAAEWCRLLWAAGVPAGPVNQVEEVFADPQVQHREMVRTISHPLLGELKLPGLAIKLTETPGHVHRHPPLLGEHTRTVLAELGYTTAEVEDLVARGVATAR